MAFTACVLVLPLIVAVCSAQYTVPTPDICLLSPNGVRFQIPDEPGMNLVAYHYNINNPLIGVGVGEYNVDINSPTDGFWVHENTVATVNPGDTVYYWAYVLHDGLGYQITDRSWTATSDPCSTNPTNPPTTAPPPNPTTDVPTNPPNPPTDTPTNPPNPPTNPPGPTEAPGTRPPNPPAEGPCSRYPCSEGCDMSVNPCNGVIFEDHFDYFDFDTWEHEITAGGGGNWEFQYYINNRTNSYVRDSTLFLKPTLTEETYGDGFVSSGTLSLWGASPANLCTGNAWWGCERAGTPTNYVNPIQSARIRTVNSFSTKYGKVEVRAKLPVGDWIWPAIWLLPVHNGYGEWPASGEIDLMEARGNLNLKDGDGNSAGVDTAASTLHWGPFFSLNSYYLTTGHKTLTSGNFGSGFHTYVVEWGPNDLKCFIDGENILVVDPGAGGFYEFGDFANRAPNTDNPWINSPNKMAPFDQEYYIVMNVAVGGTGGYWSDALVNQPYPKPWYDHSTEAPKDFYDAKNQWYPTWNPDVNNGEGAAMQVDYVRVTAFN